MLMMIYHQREQKSINKLNHFENGKNPLASASTAQERYYFYLFNAKLSKQQYLLIRSEASAHSVHIYISWNKILEAKKNVIQK